MDDKIILQGILICGNYLFTRPSRPRSGFRLQQKNAIEQAERFVLGKCDVCILVEAEDFWGVIDWQSLYVNHVGLKSKLAHVKWRKK